MTKETSVSNIETYSGGGINWCWYLQIERISKCQCKIINHWRIHRGDFDHPKTVGSYHIVEDEKPLADGWHSRNAIAVRIWTDSHMGKGLRMKVLNPGYVFGYDGKTAQPETHA